VPVISSGIVGLAAPGLAIAIPQTSGRDPLGGLSTSSVRSEPSSGRDFIAFQTADEIERLCIHKNDQ
jgi:hypothetical protein